MTKPFFALATLLLFAMCGGDESSTTETVSVATTDSEVASKAAASEDAPVDFTAADLDLYERGFAQELAIFKAAHERASSAATPAERAAAAQAQWEDQTIPAAAKAAGIDEERYRITRKAVHKVFETLDFQGKIDGPMEMDITRASEEAKAQLAKDAYSTLTPAAAAALRARVERLVPTWIEYANMTAVNG